MGRRAAFRILALSGLVAGLLPLVGPASWTVEIPRTLHALVGSRSLTPQPLPFPATHLGFEWRGSEAGPEFRTSPDGAAWSPWEPLEAFEDLSDHGAGVFVSSLHPGRDARWVEVRGADGVVVTAINTRDGPRHAVRARRAASGATPQPHVFSRAEWGADESIRKGTPRFARVRRLFVHHTVTVNNDPDPAGTIRAIYAFHVLSRGFDDIGYNFLIDASGNVYEGRRARQYDPGEEPTGEDRNGMGVVGAHVSGHNTGSAGLALLGTFTSSAPTAAAISGLVNLLAWKADRHGIDPLGSGADLIPNVSGHRDAGATACPGDQLYFQIPSIRGRIEDRIRDLSGLSAPSMPAGTVLLPGRVSKDPTPGAEGAASRSAVRVEVRFEGEGLLADRRVGVVPKNGSFVVGDGDYGGIPLPTGRHSVTAVAYDALGRASPPAPVEPDYVITLGNVPVGYWVMGTDGGVFSFGSAPFHGSTGGMRLNAPAVGTDAAPGRAGYWIVASDGGVFAFGSAGFHGSTGSLKLNRPIVDIASTPAGAGYWMVASDGGIFAFGDAGFRGSTGGMPLARPIVGMAPTPSGQGYWLVASDGGIFAFGDAGFHGSTGGMRLARPIVGMAPTPSGQGYWLIGADGGIFAFGDAGFHGSLPGRGITATATRMAATGSGGGYYALTGGGSIHAFGDAPYHGSPSASGLSIRALDLALAY